MKVVKLSEAKIKVDNFIDVDELSDIEVKQLHKVCLIEHSQIYTPIFKEITTYCSRYFKDIKNFSILIRN